MRCETCLGQAGARVFCVDLDAGWADQLDVVVGHTFLAMQIGGRAVAESGDGSMVFVDSISGKTSFPSQTAYGAAKSALLHGP